MMNNKPEGTVEAICFGLDRRTDEESLAAFLRLFSQQRLTDALIPRMSEQEIHQLVDQLTALLRGHLEENEYHRLFLGEEGHHS